MLDNHAGPIADIVRDWAGVGLSGSLLARNLATQEEIGFGADTVWALASVIKLPFAMVIYDAFDSGDLDPAEMFEIAPDPAASGSTGVSLFRRHSRIAAEDLIQLSLALSDNVATDVLLERLGIDQTTRRLAELGCPEIIMRHSMRAIYGMHGALSNVGRGMTAGGMTPGGGHRIGELDPNRANVGTARALVQFLDRVWSDSISTPTVCARLRDALSYQLTLHRLPVELAADGVRISSKTGTFANLRHEAGVVEIGDDRIAVVALTRSLSDATIQLEADFAIGHATRVVVDALRT